MTNTWHQFKHGMLPSEQALLARAERQYQQMVLGNFLVSIGLVVAIAFVVGAFVLFGEPPQ
jgi:hypothetical protein